MPKAVLTELTIRHLEAPVRGQRIFLDKNGPTGFGVRVTEHAARSYVLTYGADRKRVKLGDVGIVKLAEARAKAKDILAKQQLGQAEDESSVSFAEAREKYLSLHCTQNKYSTQRETERLLKRHFSTFDEKPLSKIGRLEIADTIDALKRSEANHAFTAVKAMLRWCVGRGYIAHDPLEGARKPYRPVARERVLSDEELKRVVRVAPTQGVYGQIVLFLVHTGQRRGQAVHLEGCFFDRDARTITWPGPLMKGNRSHTIPYGDAELYRVNDEGLVFGAKPFTRWSDSHRRFLEASETEGWTLHDLRRTFATGLAKLGTSPHIIERILDHKSGQISGVAAIYNRFSYLEEMRAAVLAWEEQLRKFTTK